MWIVTRVPYGSESKLYAVCWNDFVAMNQVVINGLFSMHHIMSRWTYIRVVIDVKLYSEHLLSYATIGARVVSFSLT